MVCNLASLSTDILGYQTLEVLTGCCQIFLKTRDSEGAANLALKLGPGPDGQEAFEDVRGAEIELLEGSVEPAAVFFPVK